MNNRKDKFMMQPGSIVVTHTPQCIGCKNHSDSEDMDCNIYGEIPIIYRKNKKRCPYYEKDMKLWDYFGNRADKVLGKPPEE